METPRKIIYPNLGRAAHADPAANEEAGGRHGPLDYGDCVLREAALPYGAGRGSEKVAASRLIESLKAGLPVQEVEELGRGLALPMDALVRYLGIPKATWHRRKLAGRLDRWESDRVLRFARLLGKAREVLESTENARRWLAAPQRGLGGAIPLEYAGTEVGAREVEDLLDRIDFGVYA